MSTRKIDLNKLCDKLHDAQSTGDTDPSAKSKQVFVDRNANVRFGDEVPATEARNLSRVQQDVFADRLSDETRTAGTKMPTGTKRQKSRDGTEGWLYGFKCSAVGRFYKMFAYWDGSSYQVLVLEPALETKWKSVHSGHLFPDGSICFGSSGGRPTLESAYAKSVVWANGMSVALASGEFPFNVNQ